MKTHVEKRRGERKITCAIHWVDIIKKIQAKMRELLAGKERKAGSENTFLKNAILSSFSARRICDTLFSLKIVRESGWKIVDSHGKFLSFTRSLSLSISGKQFEYSKFSSSSRKTDAHPGKKRCRIGVKLITKDIRKSNLNLNLINLRELFKLKINFSWMFLNVQFKFKIKKIYVTYEKRSHNKIKFVRCNREWKCSIVLKVRRNFLWKLA